MSDKLVDFVTALDIDPALKNSYEQNPRQAMEEFGVAPEDIDLILGDDMKAIKNRLEMSGLKAQLFIRKAD